MGSENVCMSNGTDLFAPYKLFVRQYGNVLIDVDGTFDFVHMRKREGKTYCRSELVSGRREVYVEI